MRKKNVISHQNRPHKLLDLKYDERFKIKLTELPEQTQVKKNT